MRPILLDLFCGAGGAGEGYDRAGFLVIGVDIDPQPNYPYIFGQAHALSILRDLLDGMAVIFGEHGGITLDMVAAIHASCPCQTDCAYRRRGDGVGDGYADMIASTRSLLLRTGKPYVIENVEGARHKLRGPVCYCGSSFGLDVRRHRLFESNVPLMPPPCDHGWQTPRFPPATNRTNLRSTVEVGVYRIPLETQKGAMGIDRKITLRELSNAIPPAYTEHIGQQLMRHIREGEWLNAKTYEREAA